MNVGYASEEGPPFTIEAVVRRRLWFAVVTAAVIGSAAVLWAVSPEEPGPYPPCPFHAVTGLHCPGCGTLRALHHLLHGDLLSTLDYNALMALSLPFLAYSYVSYGFLALGGRPLPEIRRAWLTWVVLAVVLAYWIVRNIPLFPFCLLAP